MKLNMTRETYRILSSTTIGQLFSINKRNQFVFKIGKFKGHTVNFLYSENPEEFIDSLKEMFDSNLCNVIDKYNILCILKELKTQNYTNEL